MSNSNVPRNSKAANQIATIINATTGALVKGDCTISGIMVFHIDREYADNLEGWAHTIGMFLDLLNIWTNTPSNPPSQVWIDFKIEFDL